MHRLMKKSCILGHPTVQCTYASLNTGGIKFIKLIIVWNISNFFFSFYQFSIQSNQSKIDIHTYEIRSFLFRKSSRTRTRWWPTCSATTWSRSSLSSDPAIINPSSSVRYRVTTDQLIMTVFFWYLVKSELPSVRYCTCVHWTSHFLQGTIKTRPSLSDHPVYSSFILPMDYEILLES